MLDIQFECTSHLLDIINLVLYVSINEMGPRDEEENRWPPLHRWWEALDMFRVDVSCCTRWQGVGIAIHRCHSQKSQPSYSRWLRISMYLCANRIVYLSFDKTNLFIQCLLSIRFPEGATSSFLTEWCSLLYASTRSEQNNTCSQVWLATCKILLLVLAENFCCHQHLVQDKDCRYCCINFPLSDVSQQTLWFPCGSLGIMNRKKKGICISCLLC